ncbi:hypothetical protein HQ576_01970 [bacterium]|nr:hypothetical protein [bacterium]
MDWYVLGGQQGTRAYFTIVHAAGVKLSFAVYSGTTEVEHTTGSSSGDSVTCDLPAKKQCLVKVYSGYGQGAYTLMLAPLAGAPIRIPQALPTAPSIPKLTLLKPGVAQIQRPSLVVQAKLPPRMMTLIPAGAITDEIEPNGSMVQATLTKSMVFRGHLGQRDSDWFALDQLGGKVWIFTITHAPGVDLAFGVYCATHRLGQMTSPKSGGSTTVAIPAGRCYVSVHSYAQHSGAYTMTVSGGSATTPTPPPPPVRPPAAKETEPNNTLARAMATKSMQIHGTISPLNDEDWYLWSGDGGMHPMFTITHDPGRNIDFEIRYANGGQIGPNGAKMTGTHTPDTTVVHNAPNTCAIRVWSPGGEGWYILYIGKT